MCTFYNSLPKQSKSAGIKKANLGLYMKACPDEKSYYRFRLLAFNSPDTDRDFPWIQRFMHVKYGTHPEKGYPIVLDSITCPVTPHVHVEGNRYNACKMCEVANKYFIAYKESGYKDKEAGKKNKEFGRKLEYAIPVYVVSDPCYEQNAGKFKVLILNDKKVYEEFKSKVEKQQMKCNVFNGVNAVDCCFHVSEVSEVKNEGQPNEYTWKHKVIDKIVFSTKPRDIPQITKEAVDGMGFDREYYTSSTPEEIEAFYKKWCTISNDDIPDDDAEVPVYDAPVKQPVVEKPIPTTENTAVAAEKVDDMSDDELDELIGDIGNDKPQDTLDHDPAPNASKTDDASSSELDDFLAEIDL